MSEFGERVERTIVWADISGREQHNSSLARSSWSLTIHSRYPNDHRMSNDGLTYNVNVRFFFEIYFIEFRPDSMFKSNGSDSTDIRINSVRFDVVKKKKKTNKVISNGDTQPVLNSIKIHKNRLNFASLTFRIPPYCFRKS